MDSISLAEQRNPFVQRLAEEEFDVLILGGGINGAVAAAALSKQGISVALVDRDDFAGCASSNSSNLVWGGIKYLESGELPLVRKLCMSRNHLRDHYPTLVKEIRFLATVNKGFRWPAWLIFLGALFYWAIGSFRTQPPRFIRRKDIQLREPVIAPFDIVGGVEYSDCYLAEGDSRFVFSFIRAAVNNGATVANYVQALNSVRDTRSNLWLTELLDGVSGRRVKLKSKAIINACGAYVDEYNRRIGQQTPFRHVFSKGVHLIVPQLLNNKRILAFFASDGRLFFVIPLGNYTCIGTTDTPVENPAVATDSDDREFILENANRLLHLKQPLTCDDIIAERCGVRPLVVKGSKNTTGDWLKLSRKHRIYKNPEMAFISIYGGKITDCINVGNELIECCEQLKLVTSSHRQKWYGEPDDSVKQRFLQQAAAFTANGQQKSDALVNRGKEDESVAERWWRRFGEQAFEVLEYAKQHPNAVEPIIPGLDYSVAEIALIGRNELIVNLDDFLRRRTNIAQTIRAEVLLSDSKIEKIAALLFGEADAAQQVQRYRQLLLAESSPSNIHAFMPHNSDLAAGY